MTNRNATPKELDRLLTECCELLVDCLVAIDEVGLPDERQAVAKIGRAIAEASDVRTQLYGAFPELKPSGWGEPYSDSQFMGSLEEAAKVASEYCAEGVPQRAFAVYEALLGIGLPEHLEVIARAELSALRAKHGA